jgi:hypothetical protein
MAINSITLPALWSGGNQQTISDLEDQQNLEHQFQVRTPSLYSILDTYGPLPLYSLVVGVSRDGLPFMLDLDKPRSGAILIIGENNLEKSQILRSISLSASLINKPAEVSISVITNKANQYVDLLNFPNCQRIISPYESSAGALVNEFASTVEQRRSGRERGGALMLVIDDYRSFASMLSDYSVYLNLKTLVSLGPKYGVWPIISIEPGDIHSSKGQLLRSFGTYIFERIKKDPGLIPADEAMHPSDLIYEPNFDVIIGGQLTPISNILV